MWKPIFGLDTPSFAIPDSSIVNHCLEMAEPIDLLRNAAGARNGGKIAYKHRLDLRRGLSGALGPVVVPRMQDHVMPCSSSSWPALSPSPVDDPEMNTRDIRAPSLGPKRLTLIR
jgi:hypothetical protein